MADNYDPDAELREYALKCFGGIEKECYAAAKRGERRVCGQMSSYGNVFGLDGDITITLKKHEAEDLREHILEIANRMGLNININVEKTYGSKKGLSRIVDRNSDYFYLFVVVSF